MAIREIFARFDFAWDRGALAQISAASQRAESKVRNVARAFDSSSRAAVGAGSSVGRLRSSLSTAFATNAALRPATQHFNRLGLAIGRTVNQLRAIRAQGPAAQLNRFGGVVVQATSRLGGLKGAVQDVLASLGIFGGVFGAVFAGRALINGVKELLATTDATAKMAKQLGVSAEAMQSLDAAAHLSGLSVEELRTGLTTMTRNLGLFAAMGKGRAQDVLKEMGVGIDSIEGRKPEQLFWEFGKAIASIEDPVKKSAFAQRIFGESGARLLSMFRGSSEEIDALKKRTEELGVVFDGSMAAAVENANDEMYLAGLQIERIKVGLVASLAPALMWIAGRAIHLGQAFSNLTRSSNVLQGAFLSGGWMFFAKLLGRLFGGMGGLRGAIGKIFPLLLRIGRVLLPWLAWALILDDIITFLQGGDSALGRLLDTLFGAGTAVSVLEEIRRGWAMIVEWLKKAGEAVREWAAGTDESTRKVIAILVALGLAASTTIGRMLIQLGLLAAAWALQVVRTGAAAVAWGAAQVQAIALSGSMGAMAAAAGAAAAAIGAIWLAWDQGSKLLDEVGGWDGLLAGVKTLAGGEGFFKGIDEAANAKARAEAAQRNRGGGRPAPDLVSQSVFGAAPAANTPRLPYYSMPAASGTATFYDQRTIAVQVSRDATPGQTGRAVATAVSGAQKPPSVDALRGALVGAGRG